MQPADTLGSTSTGIIFKEIHELSESEIDFIAAVLIDRDVLSNKIQR